jgi:alkylated DNA repair dioxygenase AlkB
MKLPSTESPRRIQLPDADLLLYQRLDLGDERALLRQLMDDTDWRQEYITIYGKTHPQPRLVAWHGDAGASYTYSGLRHEPLPWTATLALLRDRVQALSGHTFNSVLLNYYRDGRDSMGLHADDEPELGEHPVIASLSLGEERTLYFKHRTRRELSIFNLPLPATSLLIMAGGTQANWKHGMRKLTRDCGPRMNLTFRRVYT